MIISDYTTTTLKFDQIAMNIVSISTCMEIVSKPVFAKWVIYQRTTKPFETSTVKTDNIWNSDWLYHLTCLYECYSVVVDAGKMKEGHDIQSKQPRKSVVSELLKAAEAYSMRYSFTGCRLVKFLTRIVSQNPKIFAKIYF